MEIEWNKKFEDSQARCPNIRCNAPHATLRAEFKRTKYLLAKTRDAAARKAQKHAQKQLLNAAYPPVRIARPVKDILLEFIEWQKKKGMIARNKQQEIISDAVLAYIERSGFKSKK